MIKQIKRYSDSQHTHTHTHTYFLCDCVTWPFSQCRGVFHHPWSLTHNSKWSWTQTTVLTEVGTNFCPLFYHIFCCLVPSLHFILNLLFCLFRGHLIFYSPFSVPFPFFLHPFFLHMLSFPEWKTIYQQQKLHILLTLKH